MGKKTPISISATPDEVLALDKYAAEHGITRSEVVRILIKKGLGYEDHIQSIVKMSDSFIGENSKLLYSVLAEIEKHSEIQKKIVENLEAMADAIVEIGDIKGETKLRLYSKINALQDLIKDSNQLSKKEEFFLKLYGELKKSCQE